jgi:hypothetical protein
METEEERQKEIFFHPTATPVPSPPAQPAPPGERIGVVTHYYNHLSVATLRLESGTLRVGDVIHILGHTTDFSQRVESLEINHAPATEVGPNGDFGLKVVGHAREHDRGWPGRSTLFEGRISLSSGIARRWSFHARSTRLTCRRKA